VLTHLTGEEEGRQDHTDGGSAFALLAIKYKARVLRRLLEAVMDSIDVIVPRACSIRNWHPPGSNMLTVLDHLTFTPNTLDTISRAACLALSPINRRDSSIESYDMRYQPFNPFLLHLMGGVR
jgi:hypothetical protein